MLIHCVPWPPSRWLIFCSSLYQRILIFAGQWEAPAFPAPCAGFRDAVSVSVSLQCFSALCDMLQQARMLFILHWKRWNRSQTHTHTHTQYTGLRHSAQLHRLNLNPVKIRWRDTDVRKGRFLNRQPGCPSKAVCPLFPIMHSETREWSGLRMSLLPHYRTFRIECIALHQNQCCFSSKQIHTYSTMCAQ